LYIILYETFFPRLAASYILFKKFEDGSYFVFSYLTF